MKVHVCDWVVRAIADAIVAHAPERGGAILGPPGRAVVTRFVADPSAAVTSASYQPSRELDACVKRLERDEPLELKGVVHSHPRELDRPSDRDAAELAEGLAVNPHLATYLLPIVTSPITGGLAPHELTAGEGKISFFAGRRMRDGAVAIHPVGVAPVPLLRDLERVASDLGAAAPETFLSEQNGPLLGGRLRLDGDVELLLLASEHYPALPPVVLATAGGTGTEQVHLEWRLDLAEAERLPSALRPWFEPPGPYRRAFAPPGGRALTTDAVRARAAGWTRRYAGGDPDAVGGAVAAALRERTAGLVPATFAERSVLVAGCGSVGSYVAEHLARAGAGSIALLDPDDVEPANLSRTVFDVRDLGRPKVEALASRLLHVNPAVRVSTHGCAVDALPAADLDALARAVDVVVAATDDPAAQRTLNRFAYARGKPALFVGLYAGARGGEVLLTLPGRTPCLLCATATRHRAERAAGRVAAEPDYGTARLRGEIALAADIQHVASAAVKMAVALLLPDDPGLELRGWLERIVAGGTPYLTSSTVPEYWFYPEIFGAVPGQGAYQSVWLTPTARPECPVCGDPEWRTDPLDAPVRTPRRSALVERSTGADDDVAKP